MNKMLISATQVNEVRVALVKGQTLYDLDIEYLGFEQKKANIYKGKVSRVESSLEAAFIDYGAERHGFLPFKEVARAYFKPESLNEPFSRLGIKDALYEGQEVLVQIEKEEHANKGAALTSFISLAGSYLVLMPNNPRVGGVSRRIEGKERDDMRDLMHNLQLPEGMGLIVRTAGMGKSHNELKWDLDSLLRRWEVIEAASKEHPAPLLIHQEGDTVMRAVRDYLRPNIVEILVDTKDLYEKTKKYIEQIKPDFVEKIKFYQNTTPLFSFYQIEKQIETAYQRVVRLPSGGSISIDHTEALVSIDVNSARATKGGDIEETALNTNMEAAEEIARQLRLRDIGGLIVIDFIDMSQIKNQREVGNCLKEALHHDHARVQTGHITRFGLLEMSRQRLRPCLGASVQITCPRCDGRGTIRNVESLASSMIRMIEEEAIKENTGEIQAQFPIDLATFMLNERRDAIHEISKRYNVSIIVIPNQHLETPHYHIKRLRTSEMPRTKEISYKLASASILQSSDKKNIPLVQEEKLLTTPAVSQKIDKQTANTQSFINTIKGVFKKLFGNKDSNNPSLYHHTNGHSIDKDKTERKTNTRTGRYRRPHHDRNKRKRNNYRERSTLDQKVAKPIAHTNAVKNTLSSSPIESYPETYAERVSHVETTNNTNETVFAPPPSKATPTDGESKN